ncbi:MAG: serine/threonine-protein kinase [Vicinamibacterales bacterium]
MSTLDDPTLPPGTRQQDTAARMAFTPGEVVAGRYRMVGLLGRGGMGEVYRADDLKIGTPVALKFLPREVERDTEALERFLAEVRTARQVSHPNVCRVFDIGEVDGRHFISMEFVDGEDLATLLHRIGRLPAPKALELSRHLCAGLAAAHEQGVLHRDLKPANIMIDGHGRARITDFGIATAGLPAANEAVVGTPAYMAPEQLSGGAASRQSDLYALGLVLYEMFTGARPFEATTLAEWRRAHATTAPESPSTHVAEMPPAVERVILRCLEKSPSERPRSASQVALELPGGDPLAAAVAAGETPSPEMVAAAGGEGAISSRTAWSLEILFLLALLGIALVSPYSTDLGLAPMTKSPDVLRDRAQTIVKTFGYVSDPVDETWWAERDYEPLRWMADHLTSTDWRGRLSSIGAPVLLTYRRADVPIHVLHQSGVVTPDVPPLNNGSGGIRVVVDSKGRLREFVAASSVWGGAMRSPLPAEVVFQETGLDRARFSDITPTFTPPAAFDSRLEWEGTRAELPEMPLRVSAAWFEGHLVSVAVLGPWPRNSGASQSRRTSSAIQQGAYATFILALLGIAFEFARRNLAAGRGDRRGAARLAIIVGSTSVALRLLTTHIDSGGAGLLGFVFGLIGAGASDGFITWILYLALEPLVRRRLPMLLVGWARLLEGRYTDPRVGYDVLSGLAAGAGLALLYHIANGLPTVTAFPAQTPVPTFIVALNGAPGGRLALLPAIVGAALFGLQRSLGSFLFLCALRVALSRPWLAILAGGLVFSLVSLGGENPILEIPPAIVVGLAMSALANQRGLLSLVAMLTSFLVLFSGAAVGAKPSLWYGPYSWAVATALIALSVWMFRVSRGSRAARTSFGS